jgi:asparagine synthetase B (glutamine-hydrolysing)
VHPMSLLSACDPVVAWDGARIYGTEDADAGAPPPEALEGVAAAFQPMRGGGARVFRDRLGLGKMFWARARDGAVQFAARPSPLVAAGHPFDDIMAVPRGTLIEIDEHGELIRNSSLRAAAPEPAADGDVFELGAAIRHTLDDYLAAVAAAYPDRRAYLCLSGGLDSSTIAVVARRHFSSATAVSFDLARPGGRPSEDREVACRLASDLGMRMLEATVTTSELLSFLDLVLVSGIDWRDFNVHCALVNAALGEAIARDSEGHEASPLVITGDLPNELLVDYHAESYRGATYYQLPRVAPTTLRNVLVQGLDTCHREVGVFGAFGLTTVQPYAACVDAYMRLPDDLLHLSDRKDRVVEAIVGAELPDYIYRRPKVRAQIGDRDGGGTLAACVDRGIDGAWLHRRFAELHGVRDEAALDRFLRAGRYRAALPVETGKTYGHPRHRTNA